jgi:PAS domain S-box-containing protein
MVAREGRLGTPLRLLLALAGLLLVRTVHHGALPTGAGWLLALYLALALLTAAALAASRAVAVLRRLWLPDLARALLLGLSFADLVFISLLVFHSGGPLSDAFLLYPLLMLKLSLQYPALPEIASVAILSGPAYASVLYLGAGGWFFLAEPFFPWRYLVLLATSFAAIGVGWVVAGYQRRLAHLETRLSSSRWDVARQNLTLQQTASDLGRRVHQLRMLQEGVRAINSSLALDDLLTLIVTNAAQVVHEAHCSLALLDGDTARVAVRAASDLPVDGLQAARLALGERIAAWVVENGKATRIDHVADDPRLDGAADGPVASLISVPLIADGRPIGALTATSPDEGAFSEEDLEALAAFAAQAVIAVNNARLYQTAQEQRSELEAMLRGIGDAVVATDARLRLTVLNPIAAEIFGVQRGATAGQHLSAVIDNAALVDLAQRALTGHEPSLVHEITLPQVPGGQPPRFYQALASPVLGERGEVRGVVTVLRDITEQRELDQVKSDFLSVVSHELKTPLHSIKGFVDIILMGKTGPVTDTQRDFLGTVKQQAEALQIMINDLLEFSRLEAGHIRLRIERLLVGQLVQGVVARLAPLADEAGLQLINLVPGDFGLIAADEARLEQVITNLLSNAIKFTPQGSVTVQAADLGSQIQVSVSDTGIGIPADQLQRVFSRFHQVDGSATRSYRGAGLGLTICKHIIEYHGGRIWAESVEGQGSIFHFILPKSQPDPEALAMDFTVLPRERDS